MHETLTINLPTETSLVQGKALETAIKNMNEVKAARVSEKRSGGLAALSLWVTMAQPLIGVVAGPVIDILQKLIGTIRGQGLKGVTIELPNGGVIKVDTASVKEIEKIVTAVRAAS